MQYIFGQKKAKELRGKGISLSIAAVEASGAMKEGDVEQYNYWIAVLNCLNKFK